MRRLTTTDSYETDARFSPRSNFVSFVRDQNLYVIDLATGAERAITREGGGLVSFGMAEFIAQEEMNRDTGYWWSPDERRIALTRVDEAPVAEVERFEIQATGAQHRAPALPRHGRGQRARGSVCRGPRGRQPPAASTSAPNRDIYLPRVDWFPDGGAVAVQRQSRDQKTLELLRVDPFTGRGRVLLTEHNENWVPLNRELTFLTHAQQFIWASVRSGFQHLYLYSNDGKLVRQLTSGDYMVVGEVSEAALRAVDERARRVYFMANLESPIDRQLYWVSLDTPAAARARDSRRGLAQRGDVHGCAGIRRQLLEYRSADQRHPAARERRRACARCCLTSSMPRIHTRRSWTRTSRWSSARSPPPTASSCNTGC